MKNRTILLWLCVISMLFSLIGCGLSKQEEVDGNSSKQAVMGALLLSPIPTLIPTTIPTVKPTAKPTALLTQGTIPTAKPKEEASVQTMEEQLVERVEALSWADNVNQIILVVGEEPTRARCMLLVRNENTFEVMYSTLGWIGKNGFGKTKEGDEKTPAGIYTLSHPFGRKEDPGCQMSYTMLDDSWYWVEDGNSLYYNQMVSTNEVSKDWTEAEQLNIFGGASYNYAIAIDYNADRIAGVGSAIFIHCTHDSATKGCIGIEEELMIQTLQSIDEGAVIAIFENEGMIY